MTRALWYKCLEKQLYFDSNIDEYSYCDDGSVHVETNKPLLVYPISVIWAGLWSDINNWSRIGWMNQIRFIFRPFILLQCLNKQLATLCKYFVMNFLNNNNESLQCNLPIYDFACQYNWRLHCLESTVKMYSTQQWRWCCLLRT